MRLLRALVRRKYVSDQRRIDRFDIRFESEEPRGPGVAVRATASRGDRSIPLEYELVRDGGRWRICNVIQDGSNLVRSYRRQFDRIVRREGFDGLLARMRTKLQQG